MCPADRFRAENEMLFHCHLGCVVSSANEIITVESTVNYTRTSDVPNMSILTQQKEQERRSNIDLSQDNTIHKQLLDMRCNVDAILI